MANKASKASTATTWQNEWTIDDLRRDLATWLHADETHVEIKAGGFNFVLRKNASDESPVGIVQSRMMIEHLLGHKFMLAYKIKWNANVDEEINDACFSHKAEWGGTIFLSDNSAYKSNTISAVTDKYLFLRFSNSEDMNAFWENHH